jgi:hypothetical protein
MSVLRVIDQRTGPEQPWQQLPPRPVGVVRIVGQLFDQQAIFEIVRATSSAAPISAGTKAQYEFMTNGKASSNVSMPK